MAKPALLDPLGYLVSPEAALEAAESIIRGTARVVESGVKELGATTIETSKIISGKGLDMSGSINFKKGGENVAKSKELLEEEKRTQELKRQRLVVSSLTEMAENAKKFAHTPAVDKLMAEIDAMETGERNKFHNVQEGLKREHTDNTYAKTSIGNKLVETRRQQMEQRQELPVAPQTQGGFRMRQGELFMGTERSGGGHWSNNPG